MPISRPLKQAARVLAAACTLTGAHSLAVNAFAASPYAPWVNGPPQAATFFPISVWWQNPSLTGKSGAYPTIGAAAVGMGINIFLGLGNWPEAFGADAGELENIKSNNLYVIGGIETPWNDNNSAQSVASVLALASSIGAQANVIGYNAGDEPSCNPNQMQYVPPIVDGIGGYDPTRIVMYNQTTWMITPEWLGSCSSQAFSALQATSVGSFDFYPLTGPYFPSVFKYPKSDFVSVPNDSLWVQGMATAALIHDGRVNQPMWVFVEAGGDNLGFSGQNNVFAASVSAGSTTLTNVSGWSVFTSSWLGLTVSGSGIPAGATITQIIDSTHATMSAEASASSGNTTIAVTGGSGSNTDCQASVNLCVVNGNEYRPTPAQVNAEVWMSLINGANGIEYFCHDDTSDYFCMGDVAGGQAAAATQANLTYIDRKVKAFARVLNAPTTGICSMQIMNYTTGAQSVANSCTNGALTMSTANAAVPGMAMLKQFKTTSYLFVQSDRRSSGGASFTYALPGLQGKTATIIYDSDENYDQRNARRGAAFAISGAGQFSDVLGQNGDDYQVKVYAIK